MRVEMSRGRERKEIFATPEHRWFVKQVVKQVDGVRNWATSRTVDTQSLMPGDEMVMAYKQPASRVVISPVGVAAGFAFGDGTIQGEQTRIDLHGTKDEALVPYFSALQRRTTHKLGDGCSDDEKTSFWGFPKSWKRLPSLDEGAPFLRSWLAGYFAADGSVSKNGGISLSCASAETLERVRDIATACGIGTFAVRTYLRKGIGGAWSDLSMLSFVRTHLSPDFFIGAEHRKRFEEAQVKTRKAQPTPWTVLTVSETDRVEEVFCAVVPETHAFVLKDNILTGNCHNDSPELEFDIVEDDCRAIVAKTDEEERQRKAGGDDYHPPVGTVLRPVPWLADGSDPALLRDDYYRREREREITRAES